jgi:hypothetical protein
MTQASLKYANKEALVARRQMQALRCAAAEWRQSDEANPVKKAGNTYARTRLSDRLFASYDISPLSGPCACFSRQRGPGPRI